jgi:uncharacterized DUF497 family protein
MAGGFRWIDWNVDHIAKHGVVPEQAEYVVLTARRPWPSYEGRGRWLVRGQDSNGRYLQVAYIVDEEGTIFVIHSRLLNERERRQVRRRSK